MAITLDAPGLALCKELVDVFERGVLPRLDGMDRAMLGQVGSAWRALVASCPALPRAGLKGGVPLKVKAFVGSVARLAWAKANGCPWERGEHSHQITSCAIVAGAGNLAVLKWARAHDCPWNEKTCERGWGGAPGGAAMGAAARLPVGLCYVVRRRYGRAPGGLQVGARARVRYGPRHGHTRRCGRAPGGFAVA